MDRLGADQHEQHGYRRDCDDKESGGLLDLRRLVGAYFGVQPRRDRAVDRADEDLGQHSDAVGHAVERDLRAADHPVDHDAVALVEDHACQVVGKHGDRQADAVLPVIAVVEGAPFEVLVSHHNAAEHHFHQDYGEDSREVFLRREEHENDAEHRIEHGFEDCKGDQPLVAVLEPLPPHPVVCGGGEHHLRAHEEHKDRAQAQDRLQDRIQHEKRQADDRPDHQREALHGRDVAVPVVLELRHRIVQNSVVQIQGREDRQDLQPGKIQGVGAVLVGRKEPREDGHRDKGNPFL